MKELIEALNIFLKYEESKCPFIFDIDVMQVYIDASNVSIDDINRLEQLGFVKRNNIFERCRY